MSLVDKLVKSIMGDTTDIVYEMTNLNDIALTLYNDLSHIRVKVKVKKSHWLSWIYTKKEVIECGVNIGIDQRYYYPILNIIVVDYILSFSAMLQHNNEYSFSRNNNGGWIGIFITYVELRDCILEWIDGIKVK
jgi:hypothetical protein